jgi:hypothetical protein
MTDETTERGAAEEQSNSPITPTEGEASRTPPSQSKSDGGGQVPGEHDKADSATNTDV